MAGQQWLGPPHPGWGALHCPQSPSTCLRLDAQLAGSLASQVGQVVPDVARAVPCLRRLSVNCPKKNSELERALSISHI